MKCLRGGYALPCITLMMALLCAPRAQAIPSVFPTGVTYYDPDRAYNSHVLFTGSDQQTHLIDMNGNEVHRWAWRGFPAQAIMPSQAGGEHGHILVQLAEDEAPKGLAGPGNGLTNVSVGEVNWQGQVVWRWGDHEHPAYQNHDIRRLPNGNTLVLVGLPHPIRGFAAPRVVDNALVEVNPDGQVVWRWVASQHLDELGFTASQLKQVRGSDDPDFLHINTAAPLGPNRWYDKGDTRFAPDNLLLNARNANVAWIIDRQTGRVVWRLGPNFDSAPARAGGKLPRPVDQLVGEHDVHMIAQGLPGAGHLLIFDNQGNAGFPPARQGVFAWSRVIEVDPVTREIVWQYNATDSGRALWSFYSAFISSARRLPNGNTLIDEGQHGRLFQVTPQGAIVWEYVSPWFGRLSKNDNYTTNAIYRAQPVAYDWAPAGTPHAEQPVRSDCSDPARRLPGCPTQ
ncbi:aryl-sulfate sulfotransferase [Kushneria phosphatilytica]|uniref:ArsR family transcriptional regulator n=1 Tax=Kushneria phosphatilytica TaxID=657387 RepID=A0A1S1NNB3_9GAMM|nr:aryl-sulfate sulfotransferase [Kushneria phosphatilytica]OHV08807.1 ArsR family transcriptional regulator [Kushneria phosphatilytica]QEL12527.1 ArsR family transcriptional regulator [Kushneria phosphatilytica]